MIDNIISYVPQIIGVIGAAGIGGFLTYILLFKSKLKRDRTITETESKSSYAEGEAIILDQIEKNTRKIATMYAELLALQEETVRLKEKVINYGSAFRRTRAAAKIFNDNYDKFIAKMDEIFIDLGLLKKDE